MAAGQLALRTVFRHTQRERERIEKSMGGADRSGLHSTCQSVASLATPNWNEPPDSTKEPTSERKCSMSMNKTRVFDHSFRVASRRLRLPRAGRDGSASAGREQFNKRVYSALTNESDHQSLGAESIPGRTRQSHSDRSDRVR